MRKTDVQAELHAVEVGQLERDRDKQVADIKQKLARTQQKLALAESELTKAYDRVEFLNNLGDPHSSDFNVKKHKPCGSATAVYLFGDWHIEEKVDPATINGKNEYTPEIGRKRLERVVENGCACLDAQRGMSKISDCVIALMGDMITGHIHEDLSETNYLHPTEASLYAQDMIVSTIDNLVKYSGCKEFTVVTSFGNHGRITKAPRSGQTAATQSYEWLMFMQLERYYRNTPKVKWKVERGIHNYLDIQGKTVRFTHGDKINYKDGVGGVSIPANKAVASWNRTYHADHTYFQHFHHKLEGIDWTLGNCLIGFNPFALDIKAPFMPPSQTLAVFDKKRPRPVLTQEIYCT